MSANHPAELEELAQVAATEIRRRRGKSIYSEAKLRQIAADQIGSMVVKQFYVALARAAGGTFDVGSLVLPTNIESADRITVDDDARSNSGLPPEVELFIRIMVQALHDELCGREDTPEATKALRDEAHRYFWSRERKCLVRHCLIVGLRPDYVRELAGRAADYVYEQSQKAFEQIRREKATKPMTRADRLRDLVGDANA